jgi:hypothetical protein
MRNLYPAFVQHEVDKDIEAAQEAGLKNRDPSGIGWTDVHIIEQLSTNYSQTGLRLTDAATALGSILPRIKRFYATACGGFDLAKRDPYGSYDEEAWSFGHQHCYIKLEVKDDLVTEIWFDLSGSKPDDADALHQAFTVIDQMVPSLVADYYLGVQGLVTDREFLDTYFRSLTAQAAS